MFTWQGTTSNNCPTKAAQFTVYNIDQEENPTVSPSYVCSEKDLDNPITLTANNPAPAKGEWVFSTGNGTFANSTANVTTVVLDKTSDGENLITWRTTYTTPISHSVCTTEKTVSLWNLSVYASAGADQEICNYKTDNTLRAETDLDKATLTAGTLPTTTPRPRASGRPSTPVSSLMATKPPKPLQ